MRIEPNSFVSLECSLRDEAGRLIEGDDSSDRVEYVHGYGMLVPGLEVALSGLQAGDQREIVVPPASGYGDRDEELVMEVDRTEFPDPDKVAEGDEFFLEFPDGDSQATRVVRVLPDSVVIDANHPLAGLTLHYFVNVRLVRAAAEEEIEKAARELAEAEDADEHVCGASCSPGGSEGISLGEHEEGRPAEELIRIGTRKPVTY
jgi:FKBP-type peptidyl-prolyl cis-trans isomerase SlyD